MPRHSILMSGTSSQGIVFVEVREYIGEDGRLLGCFDGPDGMVCHVEATDKQAKKLRKKLKKDNRYNKVRKGLTPVDQKLRYTVIPDKFMKKRKCTGKGCLK